MITLKYGDVFTIAQYKYTKFRFGTDNGYLTRNNMPARDPGQPWANPLAAVLTDFYVPPVVVDYALSFGDVIRVDSDGIAGAFRVDRDHNRNVKFVPVQA